MKQIEKILWDVSNVQLRAALFAAVFFADDNKEAFETHAGTYGAEGLQRLLKEETK